MKFKDRFALSLLLWIAINAVCVSFAVFTPRLAHAGPVSDCAPLVMPDGLPAAPIWTTGTQGRHQILFCSNPEPRWLGFSCLFNECSLTDAPRLIYQAARSASPLAAFDALWLANVTWTCTAPGTDAKKLLCDEQAATANAALDKLVLAYKAQIWKVKPNGDKTARLAYLVTAGKVGAIDSWAKVGSACDVTKPTVTAPNGDVWASFGPSFTPGIVSLCSLQP